MPRQKGMMPVSLLLVVSLALSPVILFNPSGAGAWADRSSEPEAPAAPDMPDKEALPGALKKLGSDLRGLLREELLPGSRSGDELRGQMRGLNQYIPAGAVMRGFSQAPPGEAVYVYIHLHKGAGTGVVDSFAWEVANRDEAAGIAAAWVCVDRLEELAGLDQVRAVRTVLPPVTRTGSVTSEGDGIHRADLVRSSIGIYGSGIKVGVISSGVDNWENARDSGDLPGNLEILSNEIGGDDGTAMLEVIHDLAPGAALYFHDCGDNILAFKEAVNALVDAGVKVIVDDVAWIEEPFFEDGPVAQHVERVIASNDILYISAAGNAAGSHYQDEYYRDAGHFWGGDWHDFSHGGHSTLKYIHVDMEPGETIIVVLQWDDLWGKSGNDYDLYLATGGMEQMFAWSINNQDGGGDPIEVITYKNDTGSVKDVRVHVEKNTGAADRTLELYIYGLRPRSHNLTAGDSIFGHPAVPGVLAVGALNADTPEELAAYSSRGPSTIAFPAPETRAKPDICGIDKVGITGAGGFPSPFTGTSAAAAHVAAVAALAWSAAPEKSAGQIRHVLTDTAVDLGSPDKFGHGRADAYDAVTALIESQCIVTTPDKPDGPAAGSTGTGYSFSTGGSACFCGHAVLYRFDWGDGTYSDWSSLSGAAKAWSEPGAYAVRAQARCDTGTGESNWSTATTVTISTEFVYIPGDVNGNGYVDVGDAILVLRSIVGLEQLDAGQFPAADVDGDGSVTVVDAILILRYIVDLIDKFPVEG